MSTRGGSAGSESVRVGGRGVLIYTAYFGPAEWCVPPPTGPFSHLLPTYINSSESSVEKGKKKKRKQTQQECNRSGGARRINLSLSGDESRCLYLELNARTRSAETMLIPSSAHLEKTPRGRFSFYYSFCFVVCCPGGAGERRCSSGALDPAGQAGFSLTGTAQKKEQKQ